MGQNHQGDEFGNVTLCKIYHVMEIEKLTYKMHAAINNCSVKDARKIFTF